MQLKQAIACLWPSTKMSGYTATSNSFQGMVWSIVPLYPNEVPMPKRNLKLTEAEIRNAKPREKTYKLYDDHGLRLLVRPTGTKVWQYPYKLNNKSNIYTIGQYPEIGTAQARKMRDDARRLIKSGIAPIEQKANHKLPEGARNSFGTIGNEWLNKQIWTPKHKSNITRQLENDVFSYIGLRPIGVVTRQELLSAIHSLHQVEGLS